MPQGPLISNPGTNVKDALEPVLHNSTITGDVTATWVEVNFPGHVVVVAELGTIDAGVTGLDIRVVGADDGSGTNQVELGRFAAITGASDNQVRTLAVRGWKRYMAVIVDHSGTGNAVTKVVVRPKDWRQSNTATA
jgi:hypothetical protein